MTYILSISFLFAFIVLFLVVVYQSTKILISITLGIPLILIRTLGWLSLNGYWFPETTRQLRNERVKEAEDNIKQLNDIIAHPEKYVKI